MREQKPPSRWNQCGCEADRQHVLFHECSNCDNGSGLGALLLQPRAEERRGYVSLAQDKKYRNA